MRMFEIASFELTTFDINLFRTIFLNNPIILFIYSILTISTLQWCCIRFLASYCAMPGIMGAFLNMMSLGSPICLFINTMQYTMSTHYLTLWATAATAILTHYGLK
jgi:hypothetical protein